ncbi:ribonuclease P protein component [Sanguibacter sp. A246]|uniref:ribonuclease P protein component n=1 Tax=Sanguibacter sp. A246 TaxID=3457326 RepID=UPI003FD757B7
MRAGRSTMVVHHLVLDEHGGRAMVGFVVSKAVGNAVARNAVKRRLRAAMAQHVASLPDGSTTVVRALPAAADKHYDELARDLDGCLSRVGRLHKRDGA